MKVNEKSTLQGASSKKITFFLFWGKDIIQPPLNNFKKNPLQKESFYFSPCITRGKRYKVCTPLSVGKGKNYA